MGAILETHKYVSFYLDNKSKLNVKTYSLMGDY